MSELQAAVLIPQLDHLADRHDARRAVDQLRSQLATSPIAELLSRASRPTKRPRQLGTNCRSRHRTKRHEIHGSRFFRSAQVSAGEPFPAVSETIGPSLRYLDAKALTECQRASERTLLVAYDLPRGSGGTQKVIRVLETLR
ncbi:MAG: hypothetical protein R3B96_06290 [Pirellulaceae bacterium]